MTTYYFLRWILAFVFTEAVETPIYAFAAKRDFPPTRATLAHRLAIGFGASAITHPFVWFLFPFIIRGWLNAVIAAEVFAYGVEALYLHALGVKRGWLWSIIANSASLFLGLGLRAVFGLP